MNSFEKWQVLVNIMQTCILLGTVLAASYIGFKQNEINQKLSDIEYVNLQPVLSLKAEYSEPFKFINIGKGPAFNIYLLQGNANGEILMNQEKDTIALQGINIEGSIKKDSLLKTSLDEIKTKLPYAQEEIKNNIDKKINWISLVYQDINGHNFISTTCGNSNFSNQAIIYKKIK